jgi:ABC-type lipoprotein release transport system permease subunit
MLRLAFVHQQDARKLLRSGDHYQGVQLQMHNAYDADQWLLTQDLPEWRWRSWTEQMGTLFQGHAYGKDGGQSAAVGHYRRGGI